MAAGKHNTRLSITCGKYICVTWRLCWARKNAFPLVMGRGFTKVAVTGVSRGSRKGTRPCLCPWFLVLQCEEPYKWAGEEDWGTWTDVNLASAFQITRFAHYLPVSLILKNEMWDFLGRVLSVRCGRTHEFGRWPANAYTHSSTAQNLNSRP